MPPFPFRLQAVELAFARHAHITEIELHGGKVRRSQKPKKEKEPG